MCAAIGQLLLCCLLPGGLEGNEGSHAWNNGRTVSLDTLAVVRPDDRPAEVPESRQNLTTGKGERTWGTEERPGKRLRRSLTAGWLPLLPSRVIPIMLHAPVRTPMAIQARGIRLQI